MIELTGGGGGGGAVEKKTITIKPTLHPQQTNLLELSVYSAFENVVVTNNIVCVPKADLPKAIKKRIIDEVKTDKSKCVIQ